MKRKHKSYSKPKRPFDKVRIVEEEKIKKDFGLKNKREIWKSDSKIKSIREKAKKLISADVREQQALFDRLKKKGFNVNSIADVLSLTKEDYLKRRLQTVLISKGIANTPKSARQLITHKKVLVGKKLVDSPSYVVPLELEDKITLKVKKEAPKKKMEEVTESDSEEAPEEKVEENSEGVKENEGEEQNE